VESLAQEFDIMDVAAAAVKMAHAAVAADRDDREIPAVAAPAQRGFAFEGRAAGKKSRGGPGGARRTSAPTNGRIVRLFIGAGRQAGIRPGDLVGAITGEAGVDSGVLGAIEIADRFSLVEVPEALADEIIAALKASMIRGKKVLVRRERQEARVL
jgi:ATP-dependent RNA helicase DeaD